VSEDAVARERLAGDIRVERAEREGLDRLVHVELAAAEKLNTERFRARDREQSRLAAETERARQQANEWRATVTDLATGKIDVVTHEARASEVDRRIEATEKNIGDKIDILSAGLAELRNTVIAVSAGGEGVTRGGDRERAAADRIRNFGIAAVLLAIAVASFVIARVS
jgi:hypothetical protein